jgi:hypothetical protein
VATSKLKLASGYSHCGSGIRSKQSNGNANWRETLGGTFVSTCPNCGFNRDRNPLARIFRQAQYFETLHMAEFKLGLYHSQTSRRWIIRPAFLSTRLVNIDTCDSYRHVGHAEPIGSCV